MEAPLRVLLVEDSPDDAALILRHLRREGVTDAVVRVDDGDSLRVALGRSLPDVVLCDYRLPRITAIEAVELIQTFDPDLPVLVVSGTVGEEAAAEAMRSGARDFLLKDSLTRLTLAIRREVQDARRRRESRRSQEIALRAQEIGRSGGFEWSAQSGGMMRLTEGASRLLEAPGDLLTDPRTVSSRMLAGEEDRIWRRLSSGVRSVDLDVRMQTRAGREMVVRMVAEVESLDGTPIRVVGAIQDVTERRQLEAQLRMNDRLAAMGTIAAGVAHEINNPLTHLVATLPWLLANPPVGGWPDPETPGVLKDCVEVAERIAAVVRDLKTWSRPDERLARCDVGEVVQSALHLLNLEYRHVAHIVAQAPVGLWAAIPAPRLAQVFTNLLINAVQAMPARPVAQNRIVVSAAPAEDGVVLRVQDNGAGMAATVSGQVFTPFFTTRSDDGGTGLGLSICRDIVRAAGGEITVESTPGIGSTFQVWLPGAPESSPRAVASEAAVPEPTRRWRVLVVDDEPLLRKLAARVLRPHQVVAVPSVDEAERAIQELPPFDVILCDVMMPGRAGWELQASVATSYPALTHRFLFTTGGAVTREAERFLDGLPGERVLLKPFHGEDLRAAIARILGERT
jgi:signal transduction histidine kinase